MNEKFPHDFIVTADSIEEGVEKIDIFLMALTVLIKNIDEDIDEDIDSELMSSVSDLKTVHDLILSEVEYLDVIQLSIRQRVEDDRHME